MRPGKQRVEDPEALGDLQRRVVGEHDAARADADGPRCGGDLADEDLGRRAREASRVVVLGEPVATQPERVRVSCQVDGVSQRVARR
jgi:hypothetical protein